VRLPIWEVHVLSCLRLRILPIKRHGHISGLRVLRPSESWNAAAGILADFSVLISRFAGLSRPRVPTSRNDRALQREPRRCVRFGVQVFVDAL
jgi:hypothetical protein